MRGSIHVHILETPHPKPVAPKPGETVATTVTPTQVDSSGRRHPRTGGLTAACRVGAAREAGAQRLPRPEVRPPLRAPVRFDEDRGLPFLFEEAAARFGLAAVFVRAGFR